MFRKSGGRPELGKVDELHQAEAILMGLVRGKEYAYLFMVKPTELFALGGVRGREVWWEAVIHGMRRLVGESKKHHRDKPRNRPMRI